MILRDETEARAFVAERTDPVGVDKLERLGAALREENERQNLVAAATLASLWQRHIADSAQLLDHVPRETATQQTAPGQWLDLGTGAGFPGLVVAIMRPQTPVVLVESRNKRIAWLNDQIVHLELRNCRVAGDRLEQVDTFAAAAISARAFAPLPRLIELSARFSTDRTHWVLPKGRSAAQEVAQLPKRFRALFHVEQSVTDAEAGIIVGMGRIASVAEARR